MRTTVRMTATLPVLVALACSGGARSEGVAAATDSSGAVAFVNVTVVPMDQPGVLEDHTVLVRDGVITSVGPSRRVRPRAGDTVIDGRGKFLMPGLAEMHAHIPGANAPESLVRDIMFLYVANGVTTIRGMLGAPNQLVLRGATARGEIIGPTIFVGAPSLNGQSAPTAEAAVRLVREHKATGYDFLKLHPGLTRPVYDAMVVAAREAGMTFAGHVSAAVGLERTLEARQSTIDHLDGYLEASVPSEMLGRLTRGPVSLSEWVPAVDERRLRYWAGRTRDAGTWNVPTAFLWESFYGGDSPQVAAARPEMRYVSAQQVAGWVRQKENMMRTQQAENVAPEILQNYLGARRVVLKALGDSAAGLLMGTDSPQVFNVPGFALHREVKLMQDAGLTPFQIIESGTRNVATYVERDLKLDGRFGTVRVGNRADLVLLDANPLLDVGNLARRAGVMVRGRWLGNAELDRGLEEIAVRNRRTP